MSESVCASATGSRTIKYPCTDACTTKFILLSVLRLLLQVSIHWRAEKDDGSLAPTSSITETPLRFFNHAGNSWTLEYIYNELYIEYILPGAIVKCSFKYK